MTEQQSLALCLGVAAAGGLSALVLRLSFDADVRSSVGSALGPANWDFSKSWASTITAVGALLGTFATALSLPASSGPLSKADFTVLNLTFGLLAIVGPFFWATFRTASPDPKNGAAFTGKVWTFLIAASLTTMAVVGELLTLVLFVHQVGLKAIGVTLQLVIGIAAVLVWIYSYRTIGEIVRLDAERAAQVKAPVSSAIDQPTIGTVGTIYF